MVSKSLEDDLGSTCVSRKPLTERPALHRLEQRLGPDAALTPSVKAVGHHLARAMPIRLCTSLAIVPLPIRPCTRPLYADGLEHGLELAKSDSSPPTIT